MLILSRENVAYNYKIPYPLEHHGWRQLLGGNK